MEKINTNVVGLLLAKEIIGGGFIPVDLDIYLNTKYLSKELYDFRCLQYKKYVFNNRYLNDILLEFKRDYPEAYIDYPKLVRCQYCGGKLVTEDYAMLLLKKVRE